MTLNYIYILNQLVEFYKNISSKVPALIGHHLPSFLSAGYKNIDVDTGTVISYNDFARLFPIFHFDLTSQESSIFENSITPEITVNYT